MSSRTLTWLPIALLLIAAAGTGTWLFLKGRSARPNIEQDSCASGDGGHVARGDKIDTETDDTTTRPQPTGGKVTPEWGNPARESTKSDDPVTRGESAKQPGGTDGPAEILEPFSVEEAPEQPKSGSKTDGPRGIKLPETSSAATPAVKQPTGYTALKGALEPAQWDEYWSKRGMRAPEAVSTPVSGKIMSRLTAKGEPDATVGLMTFFAESEAPLALLLPVITEFTTDKDGVFSGTVSAPRRPPADNERLALYVSTGGARQIIGIPVKTFAPGVKNELGIFWTPLEEQLRVHCDATAFSGERRVVLTAELDPRRWQAGVRDEILMAFPATDIGTDDAADFDCSVRSGSRQFASLMVSGAYVQTRSGVNAWKVKTGDSEKELGGLGGSICRIVFNKQAPALSGCVMNAEGNGIPGAIVRLSLPDAQPVTTGYGGWFSFDDLPPFDYCDITVEHADYLSERIQGVLRTETNLVIGMTRPKPRIPLHVTDRDTGLGLASFSLRIVAVDPLAPDPATAKPLPPQVVEVEDPDGNYLLVWDKPLRSVTVEKLGYMPFKYVVTAQRLPVPIEVRLAPGRNLEVRPRDYTAVNAADKWFGDDKASDGSEPPGIRTYWADQWIEWEVDFGESPPVGVQGGCFDLILGCTNHGIIDNEYKFKVDVFVDGANKGSLDIKADSAKEQTGRIALGALGGKHRVRLVWKNDAYIEGQLDANIRYASVKFLEQPPG